MQYKVDCTLSIAEYCIVQHSMPWCLIAWHSSRRAEKGSGGKACEDDSGVARIPSSFSFLLLICRYYSGRVSAYEPDTNKHKVGLALSPYAACAAPYQTWERTQHRCGMGEFTVAGLEQNQLSSEEVLSVLVLYREAHDEG